MGTWTFWVLCCIPYYTIPYYTILYYTILYYTILYYTILYYTILYHTILYYTIYYTILYYWGPLFGYLVPLGFGPPGLVLPQLLRGEVERCAALGHGLQDHLPGSRTHLCIYVYMYVCIHVYIYIYTCICIYIYICIFE